MGLQVTRRDMDFPRAGWWRCPDCSFVRFFATDRGAFEGASKHMLLAHRARLWMQRAGYAAAAGSRS